MAIEYFLPDALLVQSNLSGGTEHLTDDPDNPDGLWLTALSIADIELRVSFSNPSKPLATGSGLQTFKVWLRRTGNSARIPFVTVELYENGSFVETLVDNLSIDTTSGELHSFEWNAALLSSVSGDNVEVRITAIKTDGPTGEQNTVEVGAIEWSGTINEWDYQEQASSAWVNADQTENLWDVAFNDDDQWSIRSAQEITNVEIEYDVSANTSIEWNQTIGTIGVTLIRPEITGGVEPYYYEAVSGHPGKRDVARILNLYAPNAKLNVNVMDGKPVHGIVEEVVIGERFQNISTEFFEREISRDEHRFGNLANVISTYGISDAMENTNYTARGITLFQMYYADNRWWVLSSVWQRESDEFPMPTHLLD